MAVTINEVHVDVREPVPAASTGSSSAGGSSHDTKKDVPLAEALRMVHERKMRLKAD